MVDQTGMSIWEEIEEQMASCYGHIRLNADGYKLDLIRTFTKNRLVIAVYVNGSIKGVHAQYLKPTETPCEEARRFFQPVRKRLYKPAEMKLLKKCGDLAKKMIAENERIFYRPWWSDVKPLIRHLKKTCKSVTLWQESEMKVPDCETKNADAETKSAGNETEGGK
ncbi:MAG TPA: hypothetical protein PKO06_15925 [Candidatus Ozemobacteraceae bacterium]|nr:hypothetical protein [Candidatus Ozemobacteraceae bacterium]